LLLFFSSQDRSIEKKTILCICLSNLCRKERLEWCRIIACGGQWGNLEFVRIVVVVQPYGLCDHAADEWNGGSIEWSGPRPSGNTIFIIFLDEDADPQPFYCVVIFSPPRVNGDRKERQSGQRKIDVQQVGVVVDVRLESVIFSNETSWLSERSQEWNDEIGFVVEKPVDIIGVIDEQFLCARFDDPKYLIQIGNIIATFEFGVVETCSTVVTCLSQIEVVQCRRHLREELPSTGKSPDVT
jgi:hypothetical protein